MATTPGNTRSLDQLAASTRCPPYDEFISGADYLECFQLWNALRRDRQLNPAEADAKVQAMVAALAS